MQGKGQVYRPAAIQPAGARHRPPPRAGCSETWICPIDALLCTAKGSDSQPETRVMSRIRCPTHIVSTVQPCLVPGKGIPHPGHNVVAS